MKIGMDIVIKLNALVIIRQSLKDPSLSNLWQLANVKVYMCHGPLHNGRFPQAGQKSGYSLFHTHFSWESKNKRPSIANLY